MENALYKDTSCSRVPAGIVVLLGLIFLLSFLGSDPVLHVLQLAKVNATLLLVSRLLYWLCAALLWLYVRRVEKQKMLLYKEAAYPFFTSLLHVVILLLIIIGGSIFIGLVLKMAKLSQTSSRMQELVALFRWQPPLMVFTSLTAGVTEELMFRGYLQPRLEKLFRNSTAAIVMSSLLFGLLHYRYGTIANVLVPFFIGLVFAFHYRRYHSLKVLMICHFLWDLGVSLLLMNQHH